MKLIDKDAIYLKENLDILFIALNPSVQSNNNTHYFSGKQSLFFKQMYQSGLVTENLDRLTADELVFGGNEYNYKGKNYGVIDLLPRIEETNSNKVKVKVSDVELMINRIKKYKPKNVCIIHSIVMRNFKKVTGVDLVIGYNGKVIEGLDTEFYYNYFPNGNNKTTESKVEIYKEIKSKL